MTSVQWRLPSPSHHGDGFGSGVARCATLGDGLLLPGAVLGWLAVLLVLDLHASLTDQRALGAATWLILAVLARRERAPVRLQIIVVVLFATAVEYTFS